MTRRVQLLLGAWGAVVAAGLVKVAATEEAVPLCDEERRAFAKAEEEREIAALRALNRAPSAEEAYHQKQRRHRYVPTGNPPHKQRRRKMKGRP